MTERRTRRTCPWWSGSFIGFVSPFWVLWSRLSFGVTFVFTVVPFLFLPHTIFPSSCSALFIVALPSSYWSTLSHSSCTIISPLSFVTVNAVVRVSIAIVSPKRIAWHAKITRVSSWFTFPIVIFPLSSLPLSLISCACLCPHGYPGFSKTTTWQTVNVTWTVSTFISFIYASWKAYASCSLSPNFIFASEPCFIPLVNHSILNLACRPSSRLLISRCTCASLARRKGLALCPERIIRWGGIRALLGLLSIYRQCTSSLSVSWATSTPLCDSSTSH